MNRSTITTKATDYYRHGRTRRTVALRRRGRNDRSKPREKKKTFVVSDVFTSNPNSSYLTTTTDDDDDDNNNSDDDNKSDDDDNSITSIDFDRDLSETGLLLQREIEFMVEMRCQKCCEKVERAITALRGVVQVKCSLSKQNVLVLCSTETSKVLDAIEGLGYKSRLIGQGNVQKFAQSLAQRLNMDLRTLRQSLATVAEFKGEKYKHLAVRGVCRIVQVDEVKAVLEMDCLGLVHGKKYKIVVRMFGDTSGAQGIEMCGDIYDGSSDGNSSTEKDEKGQKMGELCIVKAMEDGSIKASLQMPEGFFVWDVIGRALCIEEVSDDDDNNNNNNNNNNKSSSSLTTTTTTIATTIATTRPLLKVAAVLARSAGVGENLKKVCQCDGTVIWESSADDFTPQILSEEKQKINNVGGAGSLIEKGKVSVKRVSS